MKIYHWTKPGVNLNEEPRRDTKGRYSVRVWRARVTPLEVNVLLAVIAVYSVGYALHVAPINPEKYVKVGNTAISAHEFCAEHRGEADRDVRAFCDL